MFVMIGSEADKLSKGLFKDALNLIWLENINNGKLMIKQLKCKGWSNTYIWTPRQATQFKFSGLFPRFQFCNRPLFPLPVFAVAANNLFMLKNPLTKTVDFHGYEKSMVEEVGRDMGFQVRLIYSELGEINGSAALGLVHSGKAEMTLGFLSLTLLRSKHFAFSYPHEDTVIGMFMQRPNPLKKWLAMVWPLDNLTWLAIVANILLFTVAFWLWLGPWNTSIFSAFGVVLSFLLKKGLTGYHLNGRIRSHKTRLFLLGWMTAVFFLKIWYRSTLRAVLISPWQHTQPETFEDVLQMKPDVYLFGGGAADQFISNLDVPVFKELRNSPGYKRIAFQELGQTIELVQNDPSTFLINGIMSNYKQTMNQVFNAQNVVQKIYSYESKQILHSTSNTILASVKKELNG
ncbi:hypothetical protein TCAL_14812 [Tigriopus californicus]|uniref:Uncharacterized protein n=1 Tax=Tigriopus californicus TaxID=6832 RepID=A0A553PPG7_TIGCA|nr:hypothetical protein TCAL_14812 [Tigriopus californicus]